MMQSARWLKSSLTYQVHWLIWGQISFLGLTHLIENHHLWHPKFLAGKDPYKWIKCYVKEMLWSYSVCLCLASLTTTKIRKLNGIQNWKDSLKVTLKTCLNKIHFSFSLRGLKLIGIYLFLMEHALSWLSQTWNLACIHCNFTEGKYPWISLTLIYHYLFFIFVNLYPALPPKGSRQLTSRSYNNKTHINIVKTL